MKATIAASLVAGTLLLESGARADTFQLNVRSTCFVPTGKATVGKVVRSNNEFVTFVLDTLPESAKGFQFVFAPADNSISIVRRCDGASHLTFATSASCNTSVEGGPDVLKYANVCFDPLESWISATVAGDVVCTVHGKTTSAAGPISASGSCTGSYRNSGNGYCQLQATIGKRFTPTGQPCP